MVLVTLEGCHLLDGLVVVSVEAHKKLVRCSGEELCERHCARPAGAVKSNSSKEHVIELPSLLRLVLAVPDVRAWRVMPISRRTTK